MNRKAQEVIPADILVVDDIPANLKLLTDILTERGYRVRPASGGNLALRSAAIRLPDLILLDIKMPDMDGYEVCQALKSDEKSRDIPVIFISALHEISDKVRGFEAGGVDFITKPFQSEEVLARVETHLALRRLQERLEEQNTQLQMEIAERRKAEACLRKEEEALSRREAYFRSLIENASDMIAILNADGIIRISGPSTKNVLGYAPAELNGTNAFELLHADDLPTVMDAFTHIIRNPGVSIHKELRFLHKCGSWRILEVVARNLLENEAVKGIVINAHDITARRIAENDLIRERNQLRTLLNFYRRPDTQIHDITAFVVEECIRISESSLGFFGFVNEDETLMTAHLWSEEAMKGCATDVKPPEFHLDHAGIWAEAIRRHEPLIVNDYLRPDPRKKGYPEGHVPIHRLMSIPIIKASKAVAIMAVANKNRDYSETDLLHLSLFLESAWDMIARKTAEERIKEHTLKLTKANEQLRQEIILRERAEEERRRSEQRLQQAQKAESLGRMAGAIAHHFNNLLGVVMGNLELAMLDLPQRSGPRANIAEAMAASGRAADISRLMLAYLGQSVGTMAPIELSEVCREALPLLSRSLPEKVHLNIESPDEGPIIQADAVQIRQVLNNLVVNAGEAMGEREGNITVAVREVPTPDIRASRFYPPEWEPKDESYACLSVADTGMGMDPGTLGKAFDPFFSTKFTGRGLGLAVVLGVVKAHEGAITVESVPGRGAIFRVFLPLSVEELPRPRKAELVDAAPSKERGLVLLVEDEPTLRKMAGIMLEHLGCEVITARDGAEALEVFRKHQDHVQCVLLDLIMPRMDGWATLAALRALRPHLPVILASGYDEAKVMQGCHLERPQAFLPKPYQIKDLEAALDAARKRSLPANERVLQ
jgi:PAS domain S-box-containing protein